MIKRMCAPDDVSEAVIYKMVLWWVYNLLPKKARAFVDGRQVTSLLELADVMWELKGRIPVPVVCSHRLVKKGKIWCVSDVRCQGTWFLTVRLRMGIDQVGIPGRGIGLRVMVITGWYVTTVRRKAINLLSVPIRRP